MLQLFNLVHNDKRLIGFKSPIDPIIMARLKMLDDFSYTKTHRTWYIPYAKSSFKAFKSLKIPFRILNLHTGTTDDLPSKSEHTSIPQESLVKTIDKKENATISLVEEPITNVDIRSKATIGKLNIEWNGKGFRLKLPFVQVDIDFLKSLKGSYWNENYKCWIIKSTIANLKKLQDYFAFFGIDEYSRLYELISLRTNPQIVTLYQTPQYLEKLIVRIEGHGADISYIKGIVDREYDKDYQRWILPLSEELTNRIIEHYTDLGAKIINRLPNNKKNYHLQKNSYGIRVNHFITKFPQSQRSILEPYISLLSRQHYSWNTVTSYCKKLSQVMHYFKSDDLDQISADQINDYLYCLTKKDISHSAINVVFSAIKLYFEKISMITDFKIEKMKRPKKGRYLPTILSIGEVERMLKSTKNLKHLSILYTIYGGGLRLNELLNLRVKDIHWERNQLFVNKGKGKKDRMVMLSQSLKQLLERYFAEYKPQFWLFEGKDRKTNYSSRSVQAVVKRAARVAGISRRVSPHTLRHCFATHLLDHGTDVRYIQELLGHKDIKTTLIYTHVTTRKIGQIESPLDKIGKRDITQ